MNTSSASNSHSPNSIQLSTGIYILQFLTSRTISIMSIQTRSKLNIFFFSGVLEVQQFPKIINVTSQRQSNLDLQSLFTKLSAKFFPWKIELWPTISN